MCPSSPHWKQYQGFGFVISVLVVCPASSTSHILVSGWLYWDGPSWYFGVSFSAGLKLLLPTEFGFLQFALLSLL